MTLRKRVRQLEENVWAVKENIIGIYMDIANINVAKSYELDKKHEQFYQIAKEIKEALSGQAIYDRQDETHFTRGIDELGRIVIPKELREKYQVIDGKDSFNIWTKGDYIVLKKGEKKDEC